MKHTALIGAALAGVALAKDSQTFAVMRFNGDPIFNGLVDPIINPGSVSPHDHTVFGGSNFGIDATGESLMKSSCSSAKVKGDNSAYWMPRLYFHDEAEGTFESVPVTYSNVYYFFDATDDDIKAFPIGLQLLSGDKDTREPTEAGANTNLDPEAGPINPVFFTCARNSFDQPSYPEDSDGSEAGMGCPGAPAQGVGFPLQNCDAMASPLRADVNFPSCYNPDKELTDYQNNMAWPTAAGNGKLNCPEGYVHVPRLLFEIYWDTQSFADRWTPDGKTQPFVFSNGDVTGYSLHGDVLAAWDEDVLQHIIDSCDVQHSSMDTCPGVQPSTESCTCTGDDGGYSTDSKRASSKTLPGVTKLSGFKYGKPTPEDDNAGPLPDVEKPSNAGQDGSSPGEGEDAPVDEGDVGADSPAPEGESVASSPAPAPEFPAPTAAPVCVTKTKTVMETVTVWDDSAEATAAAKRHVQRHAGRHH